MTVHSAQLAGRYERIADQLVELFTKTEDITARMATSCALLHHKMPHFFWTGFYRLAGKGNQRKGSRSSART